MAFERFRKFCGLISDEIIIIWKLGAYLFMDHTKLYSRCMAHHSSLAMLGENDCDTGLQIAQVFKKRPNLTGFGIYTGFQLVASYEFLFDV